MEKIKNAQDSIREFMEACEQEVNYTPKVPPKEAVYLRAKLTLEEVTEFIEALFNGESRKLPYTRMVFVSLKAAMTALELASKHQDFNPKDVNMKEVLDAITDIEYVNIGAANTFGFDLEESFNIVHGSNMSKLVDGKAVKDEFGKVIKGPNYYPPNLDGLY
jgi:predicted HAD superfamily Cof-like phosphohydrolase